MESKADLRIRAKKIRKTLDIDCLSFCAVKKIRELDCYKKAQNVMIFYPMKYEINLLELLTDNKRFYLPKICSENLSVCPFNLGDKLLKSYCNVFEPCCDAVEPSLLDLIIVPALMADKKNYRLGYGKGFYDRFLAAYPKIPTVLPIAKELVVDDIGPEEFDIKTDYVIVC